jgi:ribosome-associated heat shock protein Hsp15
VRIDKWLWAARFFKTRAVASRACELGRIQSNGNLAKPSREVKVGDTLHVKTEGGDFEIRVLALCEMRGPAAAAQLLYLETEESRATRERIAQERRLLSDFERMTEGRPSKKDRRNINRLRGR